MQHKKGGFYPENDPKTSFPDLTTFVDEVRSSQPPTSCVAFALRL
jgi:hypothetical protein